MLLKKASTKSIPMAALEHYLVEYNLFLSIEWGDKEFTEMARAIHISMEVLRSFLKPVMEDYISAKFGVTYGSMFHPSRQEDEIATDVLRYALNKGEICLSANSLRRDIDKIVEKSQATKGDVCQFLEPLIRSTLDGVFERFADSSR